MYLVTKLVFVGHMKSIYWNFYFISEWIVKFQLKNLQPYKVESHLWVEQNELPDQYVLNGQSLQAHKSPIFQSK